MLLPRMLFKSSSVIPNPFVSYTCNIHQVHCFKDASRTHDAGGGGGRIPRIWRGTLLGARSFTTASAAAPKPPGSPNTISSRAADPHQRHACGFEGTLDEERLTRFFRGCSLSCLVWFASQSLSLILGRSGPLYLRSCTLRLSPPPCC